MMRRLACLLLLASSLTVGCADYRDPSVPPFRVAPYGPGLELATGGRRLRWIGPDAALAGSFKASRHSVRIYDAGSVRLARLTVTDGGYRLVDREGDELCRIVLGDDGNAAIACVDGRQLAVERLAEGLLVRTGAGETLATVRRDGENLLVEQAASRTVISDEGSGSWQIVREGSGEPVSLGQIEASRDGELWAAALAIRPVAESLAMGAVLGWVFERVEEVRPSD